jgi:2-isopropylmalate synthase
MVKDSVEFFTSRGVSVVIDAEHFFDGYDYAPEHPLEVVRTAFQAGARCVVLCDTNGGSVPSRISRIVSSTIEYLEKNTSFRPQSRTLTPTSSTLSDCPETVFSPNTQDKDSNPLKSAGTSETEQILGIHAHNDTGCAVANSIAAVQAGVRQVQGTVNEYGERTGNANILTIVADLELKLGIKCVPDLTQSFALAHNIAEIANINLNARQPYVGDIAFAHKAGLHASAIKVDPHLYQHIDPQLVGNDLKMIISEMAGRSSIELKAGEMGFNLADEPEKLTNLTHLVKEREAQGYTFDSADASFELMLLEQFDKHPEYFKTESWRVFSERQGMRGTEAVSEGTVKLRADGKRIIETGEGNGPVNALDAALRLAIQDVYPEIKQFELTDYRVRLLDTSKGTDSVTRVLLTCYDSARNSSWTTVGVGGNIVEASWEALVDCYIYGLIKKEVKPKL